MKVIPQILTSDEIERLITVSHAREKLNDKKGQVNFFTDIPEDIRIKLSLSFGFELDHRVPLRWIRGDSVMHSDHSWDNQSYLDSYIVYLTDSDGLFIIEDQSFLIRSGDGYSFEEGKLHGTRGATEARLLLGPFNERTVSVGYSGVY